MEGLKRERKPLGLRDRVRGVFGLQESGGVRVREGMLDISSLSNEELESISGIEPGVVLEGVEVLYPSDIRATTFNPYLLTNRASGYIRINGKLLAIDKRKNPTLPTRSGLQTFEITEEDDSYYYISALPEAGEAEPVTLEPKDGVADFSGYADAIENERPFSIPNLEIGTILQSVYIDTESIVIYSNQLPLEINGRSVRMAGDAAVPASTDYYYLVVRGISEEDIFVDYAQTPTPPEDSLDSFETKETYNVGSVIDDVRFERNSEGRYVASNPEGKAFVLDTSSEFSFEEVFLGLPVKVRIIRDTKPGQRDGFYVVSFVPDASKELLTEPDFLRETPYQQGEIIENVTFEERNGNVVSSNPNGKAFLLDISSTFPQSVLSGEPVNVTFIRDTKPGKLDGFYVVSFESRPTVRQFTIENNEIDFGEVYTARGEQEFVINGLREGDLIRNLELSGIGPERNLKINGRDVYNETSLKNYSPGTTYDYKVTTIESGYIDLEAQKPISDYDAVFLLQDNAVDFSRLNKENFAGTEEPDIYVAGISEGVVLKNIFFTEGTVGSGSSSRALPFLLNGKRVDYEDSVVPERTGFYDCTITQIEFEYYDVVPTTASREKIGDTQRVTIPESLLAEEPQHEAFFRNQVEQLRTPSLQTALRLARVGVPDMSYGREVLARSREMRQMGDDNEKHRHFTALGAALFKEKAAYRSFNAGVDIAVQHASDKTREWLKNWEGEEPPRMPLAVVGSGPHGATFLSSYRMYESQHSPLVIDQRPHIGGQFADAEEPVFRLNSRNRPQMEGDRREERNLPGGEQTINPLGTMATLQVSDLSGESYVTQDALAYATRFNTVTSASDFLTECKLVAIEHVTREDGAEAERCTFFDEAKSATYTIDFDELVIAGGIGVDVFNLQNEDGLTREFLGGQKVKLERGERPLVMSFPQMVSWFGNPANKSPLKGVREVVVSGSGDSANVAVGLLLGYEPGSNQMPVSLDRVEKVYWMGQNIPTKEEWLRQIRTRYSQVGLEFPRERIESYYSRIVPISEKAVDAFGLDKVSVYREGASPIAADLYIACNGFRNDLPGVLAANTLEDEPIVNVLSARYDEFVAKIQPGLVISDRDRTLRVIGSANGVVEYTLESDQTEIKSTSVRNFYDYVTSLFGTASRLQTPQRGLQYEELFDEAGFAVGKRIKDTNITLVGPVSDLSISRQERQTAPVLEQIPENTAALFRYGRGTEITARLVAERLKYVPADVYDRAPEERPLVLQKGGEEVEVPAKKRINLEKQPQAVPYHVAHMEALKISLADHLEKLQFPPNLSEAILSISVSPYFRVEQTPFITLEGLSAPNVSENESARLIGDWLSDIGDDAAFMAAIEQETQAQLKTVVGKDLLRAGEVSRKAAELEELTGTRPRSLDAKKTYEITLRLKIPLRGARPDVTQLQHEWISVV